MITLAELIEQVKQDIIDASMSESPKFLKLHEVTLKTKIDIHKSSETGGKLTLYVAGLTGGNKSEQENSQEVEIKFIPDFDIVLGDKK